MKNYKHILFLVLVFILTLGILPFTVYAAQIASPMPFTDVPTGHWAYENIATMSQGNLIKGYGDGRFGPDDQFNIDQMAQMICNVKGYDTVGNPATDGCAGDTNYWAYGAVEFCVDCGWLPKQGQQINAETYSVPCTRELAVYMIVKSLGYNAAVNDPYNSSKPYIKEEDIPDFGWVDVKYMDAVADAYKLELVEGVDETHRFNPKGKMTRAEAATMLLNAGWTEGRTIPELGEAPSTDELYERIQQLDGWDERIAGLTGRFELHNIDKETSGRIVVSIAGSGNGEYIHIVMQEDNRYADNPDWYTGSAYSYAGRMRLKEILQAVYPNQTDFNQAWDAVKMAFLQKTYHGKLPGFSCWIGHRQFEGGLVGLGSHEFVVNINAANHSVGAYCGEQGLTDKTYPYTFLGKTTEEAYAGFEFDKW